MYFQYNFSLLGPICHLFLASNEAAFCGIYATIDRVQMGPIGL